MSLCCVHNCVQDYTSCSEFIDLFVFDEDYMDHLWVFVRASIRVCVFLISLSVSPFPFCNEIVLKQRVGGSLRGRGTSAKQELSKPTITSMKAIHSLVYVLTHLRAWEASPSSLYPSGLGILMQHKFVFKQQAKVSNWIGALSRSLVLWAAPCIWTGVWGGVSGLGGCVWQVELLSHHLQDCCQTIWEFVLLSSRTRGNSLLLL